MRTSGQGWSFTALRVVALVALASCGGGGNTNDPGGREKTQLTVAATDADGDALHYQWRVTAGTVENRDLATTTWTLPEGPGLHFAYVTVSDGKGGYAQMQYAVSSDALNTVAPTRSQPLHTPPPVTDFDGVAMRLRFRSGDTLLFAPPEGGAKLERRVYLPDVVVRVTTAAGEVVFAGATNRSGEVALPKLRTGQVYSVRCAPSGEASLSACDAFTAGTEATVRQLTPPLTTARNLRLFGHVGLADGGVCDRFDEFFNDSTSATVRLKLAGGVAIGPALRVNRFGDYALDAAVPVLADLQLEVTCEGYTQTLDVPPAGAAGYQASQPVELSHQIPNRRPVIQRMVANGPDGNVRGRTIEDDAGSESSTLPGAARFLAFKGLDTRQSACAYYRAIGMVAGCDTQGGMVQPVTMEDWKRRHRLTPYESGNTVVSANYINRMDLNLIRRMSATQTAADNIAFLVCNHPGPEGQGQREVDDIMHQALSTGERMVACVGMEWSTTAGVNGGRPFTKFVTFGPDGALRPSVNLDGRGEKFLPGTCVACHGGMAYNGRFPDSGSPSPYLGSGFLPFDNGNYLFMSSGPQSEAAQSEAIYQLNQLVRATEALSAANPSTPVTRLIDGWYAAGQEQNKSYVAPAWQAAEATTTGAAQFYREVIGAGCRTCHVSLGPRFDWDSLVLQPERARTHVCGGTADVALNATMPNALSIRDRIAERVRADASLAALKRQFLGCEAPLPDPVYPAR